MNRPGIEQPSGFIVCERDGHWAAAWRKALASTARGRSAVRITETRSLAECGEALREAAGSFVSIEMTTANLAQTLEFLTIVERDFPAAAVVVTAPRAMEQAAEAMREFGAVACVTSPRRLEPLALAVRRHLANQPQATSNVIERIRADLPWSAG